MLTIDRAELRSRIYPECVIASTPRQIATIGKLSGNHIIVGGKTHILRMVIGCANHLIVTKSQSGVAFISLQCGY